MIPGDTTMTGVFIARKSGMVSEGTTIVLGEKNNMKERYVSSPVLTLF